LLGVMHVEVMLGRTTSEESRAERFRALAAWAGQPIDRATADELAQSYRAHYQRLRRPVAGAPETVRRLRGRARVGVVTNHTVAEQTEKLAFLGLERDVDFLLTSEEVGAAKPDPAIFRAALARAGAEPHEAVMVGDSWSSDVAGAVGAGIRAVWFNRFHLDRPAPMPVEEFGSFRSRRRVDELLGFSAARSRVR
jgi:HAD superfamily hydrolase (TIGR01549 family)